jgi:glutathione S-transferase
MNSYTLHYAPDNASLIIRLALEALGQPYRTVLIDRKAAAHTSPPYLKLNPHGLIPVLEGPDGPIFETAAILLWLADRHEGLGPQADSPQRADFLKWLFFISNTVHTALRMTFYPEKYAGPDPAHQAALRATMQDALKRHLTALDARAAQEPFALAIQLYLGPLLRWSVLYPVQKDHDWFNLDDYPNLKQMCLTLDTLPCTKAAQTAEGLGPTPFSSPRYATPPQGSAT